jgi:hypothetical protein
MADLARGYALRPIDMPHGYADPGVCQVSFGKTNPQTNTISLFTVVGSIQATLVGVVSTVFGAVAQHLTLGITGKPAAIAAASAVALNATAVGSVLAMPQVLGGALPAPLVASGHPSSAYMFACSNTIITATSDASTTGAVTWILFWIGLGDDQAAQVTTN